MTTKMALPGRAALAGLGMAVLVAAALAIAPGDKAGAQSAIKALVNNEPITTYDIQNRAQFLKLTSGGKLGESAALDQLIEERLKLQEAKRRNVKISDDEVTTALDRMAQRSKMTADKLEAALRQAGVNPKTLRDRIRAELGWSEVVRARFRATVRVTDQDVAAALDTRGGPTEATIAQYDLQPIIFIIPNDASKAFEDQRQREAEAFRSRYSGCETAIQLAKGLKDVVVQNMVRRDTSQLNEPYLGPISATEVGKISTPVRMQQGLQLFGVCDKRDIRGQSKESDEARSEIMSERGQLLARRYLRDLRSDAIIDYR